MTPTTRDSTPELSRAVIEKKGTPAVCVVYGVQSHLAGRGSKSAPNLPIGVEGQRPRSRPFSHNGP